jgi:hypothetical protein
MKTKILTTGILPVFRGLKFESDPSEIGFEFHGAGTNTCPPSADWRKKQFSFRHYLWFSHELYNITLWENLWCVKKKERVIHVIKSVTLLASIPIFSLRSLVASFIRLWSDHAILNKDYPWSDCLEKLPDPWILYVKIITLEELSTRQE